MSTRKLAASLVTAFLTVGLGSSLSLASTGERRCLVSLEGGGAVTVSVWGACSTANVQGLVDRVVVSVADVTPPAVEEQPPAPAETVPAVPTPSHDDRSENPTTTPTPAAPGEEPATTTPRLPVQRTDTLVPREELEQANEADEQDEKLEGEETSAPDTDVPTTLSPAFAFSIPGPIQVGIPNASIDSFGIPPFLLSIYQAAGSEYDVPWSVLAAINEVETGYGRNLNVSSAGAMGWMQFIPSSWETYGVDANGDGRRDPYNPVDSIFAAARYLRAAGAKEDLAGAVFAYNHADWYVDLVLSRARQIDELPDDLVAALTGLAQGRFPVAGRASYAGDASPTRRSVDIRSGDGAAVVAVNDGVIARIGRDPRLGRFVELRDVYGNLYTYGGLARVASSYPAPKPRAVSQAAIRAELKLPAAGPRPTAPASAGRQSRAAQGRPALPRPGSVARLSSRPPRVTGSAAYGKPVAGFDSLDAYSRQMLDLREEDVVLRQLRPGAQVIGGTVLGRIGAEGGQARLTFGVRPAGEGSPAIDPKPVLDGWRKLESAGGHALAAVTSPGQSASPAGAGQVLLLGKESLERRVLADPRIEIYDCGRRDIQAGQVDRRVLAALEFLASAGLKPTITSLRCGHSFYTRAGGVSEHSSGNAVDIAAINGVPILGNQGPGSVTEQAIRRLLSLQGGVRPHQIISLMTFEQTDNTLSMSDHADHIHVGFEPPSAGGGATRGSVSVLGPDQWSRVTARINQIYEPAPARSAAAKPTSAPGTVAPSLPRLRAPAPAQAGELDRLMDGRDEERKAERPAARIPDDPSIEVKPYLLAPGDRLTVKGRGWVCEGGSRAGEVVIELGQGGPRLGTARPDRQGEFKQEVRLAGGLLPDDVVFPAAFVIAARAQCPQGEELATGDRSPTILVVEEDGDGDGNGGGGGGNGDDGGGDGAGGDERPQGPDASGAEADDDTDDDQAPVAPADGQPEGTSSDGSGETGEGGGQTVLGEADSGGDGGGDDSDGKRKRDKNRGDGDSGGGGGDGDGDDDGDEAGGGGGGKDRKLELPKSAPALVSEPPKAPSSDSVSIPDINGFGLGDALFVVLCLLGFALVAALAYAGRWLGVSEPVDSEAPTQVMRRVDPTLAGPRGGPS